MKLIQLKRGRALPALAAIVVCAALVLSFMSKETITTFKNNAEMEKIQKQLYKSYSALGGKFSFKLPDTWSTWNETFGGGEILYHMYFLSPDKKVNGFVQVWKLDKPLKQFIEESKSSATGVVDFKNYKVKEIMSDRKTGYLIDYTRANDKGEYFRGYEAFIEGRNNTAYRVSFFMDEKSFKPYYIIIFNRVIQSFDIKE